MGMFLECSRPPAARLPPHLAPALPLSDRAAVGARSVPHAFTRKASNVGKSPAERSPSRSMSKSKTKKTVKWHDEPDDGEAEGEAEGGDLKPA